MTERLRIGVAIFPGSNCDHDALCAVETAMHAEPVELWHDDAHLAPVDAVLVPGGFSYGDALRCGAIAARSPIMSAIRGAAAEGLPVLGICNGFQILCEAGLLPGALVRNAGLSFRCEWIHLRVERTDTPFTNAYAQGRVVRFPIAHGEGQYVASPETLAELEANGHVVFRYVRADGTLDASGNPNGSVNAIAGISNRAGNVVGLMPHPERAIEMLLGSDDGLGVFDSLRAWLTRTDAAGRTQGPPLQVAGAAPTMAH